jgi:predicted RNase H-like nuclease
VTVVVGLDGCPNGWVAVRLTHSSLDVLVRRTLADILSAFADGAVIGVDAPIGLPSDEGFPRRADLAARRYVGQRRKSVFLALPRAIYEAPLDEARAMARDLEPCEPLLSQAHGFGKRIFEVEANLEGHALREVHPEVSFRALAGCELPSKRSWNGQRARVAALRERAGIVLPEVVTDGSRVPADDLLDATAAAWSARRVANGTSQALPTDAAPDEPRIWY